METITSQRICSNCETTNRGTGKFCIKCGALLPMSSSPEPPSVTPEPPFSPPQPISQPAARQGKIEYDPQIIEKFAVRLYRTAKIIVAILTIIGLLGGGFGGYTLAFWGANEIVWAVGGALVLGGIGFWIGWEIAFRLKLRAQLALCQVQIEENGR